VGTLGVTRYGGVGATGEGAWPNGDLGGLALTVASASSFGGMPPLRSRISPASFSIWARTRAILGGGNPPLLTTAKSGAMRPSPGSLEEAPQFCSISGDCGQQNVPPMGVAHLGVFQAKIP